MTSPLDLTNVALALETEVRHSLLFPLSPSGDWLGPCPSLLKHFQ
jgi:hypothetical protein